MSKSSSGHFKGTKGDKKSRVPLFDKGHVTYKSIADNREKFMGKTVEQIAEMLEANGYEFEIHPSKRQDKGSTAIIIEITNSTKERNIKQVQVSPDGSNRHGNIPYVKISTSDEGKIKVIEGTEEEYKTSGNEKAKLIFKEE